MLYQASLKHSKPSTTAFIVAPPPLDFTEVNLIVPRMIFAKKLRDMTFPVCVCLLNALCAWNPE